MEISNAIAMIVTTIGTGVTVWQAYKAKSYRDDILEDRQKISLIELKSSLKQARTECQKITTPVSKPFRGVDIQRVIDELQNFLDKLKENIHKIKLKRFQESINTIEKYILAFKNENEQSKRDKIGDDLLKELSDLGGFIAENIDKKV